MVPDDLGHHDGTSDVKHLEDASAPALVERTEEKWWDHSLSAGEKNCSNISVDSRIMGPYLN